MVDPILLIVVPLGFAFCIPIFGLISKKVVKYIPPIIMLFNLVVSIILLPRVIQEPIIVNLGGFPPPFCISLYAGPVGILFSSLIALIGFLVSIYAMDYIREGAEEKYHILYLLLLIGATGVVLTGDIFNLFVFYEILCISSYALVAYLGNKAGVESASKYLIQGAIGTSLILIAIALLYGQFGTLNMADIARNINSASRIQLFVPLGLFITGFGVEAAIFPINAWLPDAHSSAPSSISAILSSVAIKIGVYGMIRMVFTIFNAGSILHFLALIGLITLLVGELAALRQNNLKRMLAYSSTGQIGLIIFAFGIASTAGIQGALFQIMSHALAKALLFLAAGYMIYRTGTMDIDSFQGIGKKMPITSLAFAVGVFSLIGFPPFIGFPSKFLIVLAALAEKEPIFTVFVALVLLGTIIEGAYFFRVIQTIYFKEAADPPLSENDKKIQEAPVTALIPIIILVMLIVMVGLYPKPVGDILHSVASKLLDRTWYIQSVFGGM